MNQTRNGHIPIFRKRVFHPAQGKMNFPRIRETLQAKRIIYVRQIHQGKIVRGDAKGITPAHFYKFAKVLGGFAKYSGQMRNRMDAMSHLPHPV
jgi:hypothetical protein